MKQSINSIAREYLDIPTLRTQNRDSLDFHDVAVWGVKSALEGAYRKGLEDQAKVLSYNRKVYAWGNPIGKLIRTMERHDFSQHDAGAVLLSLGIEYNPRAIQRIYGNKHIEPATLSDEQMGELRYRANLYSDKAS